MLPLTLDMMKLVNDRFGVQLDCGGIAGTTKTFQSFGIQAS
jgi:hypothetical protein